MAQPRVFSVMQAFRAALLRRERAAATRLVNAYGEAYQRLLPQIEALIVELEVPGVKDWKRYKLQRLETLKKQIEREINEYAVFADRELIMSAREALNRGALESKIITQAALPGIEPIDARIMQSWNRVPGEAVETLLGFMDDGSPLRESLRSIGTATADIVEKRLTESIVLGYNPRKIAGMIRNDLGQSLTWSLRTARTTQIYSYREAARANYIANDRIVRGWTWRAARSDRTCMSCFVDWKVPILTSTGFKPIGKISIGDLVLTHKGRFKKVTEVMRQSVDSAEVVTISVGLSGGKQSNSLTMTVEHPVLTQRGWVRADNLTTNDKIAAPTKPCEVCGEPMVFRYHGGKVCSRSCVGTISANALHANEQAHNQAIEKMTKTIRKMVADGTHTSLRPEIRKKMTRASLRANSLLVSSRTEGVLTSEFTKLGLVFETQLPIFSHHNDNNNRDYFYYADFAFPEQRVIVEADGEPWHTWDKKRIEHDKIRQERIEAQGWTVLRYTGAQIQKDAGAIGSEVRAILRNHDGEYGRAWLEIENIERSTRNGPSPQFKVVKYNLEVEDDHSYVAKFAVVHNCIAMDGTKHPLTERLNDHQNGRCFPEPDTFTYRELGIDIDEPAPAVAENARAWFERQPEGVQRQMMGNAKYDAWKAGEFDLGKLTKNSQDSIWGEVRTETPLKDLIRDKAA